MADNAVAHSDDKPGAGAAHMFRLYVAGHAPNSLLAIDNFKLIARDHRLNYELEIVDILSDPLRALNDGVLVTPTLVHLSPPVIKIIGNLSDISTVAISLGLARAH